jgi:transcriptional regulator GlxA family with amidase domain
MDMALAMVAEDHGQELALATARMMETPWRTEPVQTPFLLAGVGR